MNTDTTSILRLNDWAGRVVLVFYGVGTTIVALLNLGGLTFPLLGVVSLIYLWGGLAILAWPDAEPFGLKSTVLVVTIVLVVTGISSWNIIDLEAGDYSSWYLGAMTFLLFVLALRGRRWLAWLGFVLMSAEAIVVAVFMDQNVAAVVTFTSRQAAILLIGTLFAIALRRSSQTITAIQNNQLARATQAASTAAATRERAIQNARLERDARPALERIRSGEPLTEQELREIALLESTLRDGIRAAGFSSDHVALATRSARARGLRVVLLDDRGAELGHDEREQVEAALLDQLESTAEGSITARLSPHDRDELATIVVEEGGEYRRIVVRHSEVEVTHLS